MFKKLTAVLTLLFCFSVVFFSSPKVFAEGNTATVYDDSFNTENIITFYGQNAVEAANAVQDELQRIDGIFSLTKDSEASRLNRDGYLIDASDDFVYVMNRAKELYLATDGAFNPATYLLTDLWQLSGRFADGNSIQKPYDRELYTLPQQKYIDAFRQLLNFGDIRIEGNDVYLPQNSVTVDGHSYIMNIDLGGIVKGYAAMRAKEIAADYSVTQGFVNLGGSSITFLENPSSDDKTFSVGVINPEKITSYYAKYNAKNLSMSTSGDYQPGKYFELDGKRYCHIINPETGMPVDNGMRTVSIFCDDPIAADALTTALMVMGDDEARAFINGSYFSQNEISATYVFERSWTLGSVLEVVTNGFADDIQLTDPSYRLCGYMTESGFVYNPLNPDLWLVLSCVALCLIAAGIVIYVKRREEIDRLKLIKKQKFFLFKDIFVYAVTAVAVVVLFVAFVFTSVSTTLEKIEVFYKNDLVFSYSLQKGEWKTYCDFVTVEEIDGKTLVTVETDGHKNVIEIFDGKAKMAESDCSSTKECVNNFPAIDAGGQAIVCDVNHVKVVGQGEKEAPILNG